MSKIKIVFLSIFNLQNPSTITLKNYAIELAKLGHEVTFIAAPSISNTSQDQINMKFLLEFKKPLRSLSLTLSSLFRLLETKKVDILHFGKPLPVTVLPCFLIKKIKHVPIICQMDDLESSFSTHRNFLEKSLIRVFEIESLRYVDGVVAISRNLKKLASQYCKNVIYLPHLSLVNKFRPDINGSKIRKLYGWERKKVLMFTGHIGKYSDAEICIRAIKYVIKENKNIVLVIIGWGEGRKNLEKLVKDLKIENYVHFLDPVPYEFIQEYLAAADILLLPIRHEWINSYYRSPLKMFDYMAMGKLIVAQEVGETSLLKGKAILTKPTIEDFAKGIIKGLYTKKDLGKKARNYAEKKLYMKQVKRLEKFYMKLI